MFIEYNNSDSSDNNLDFSKKTYQNCFLFRKKFITKIVCK